MAARRPGEGSGGSDFRSGASTTVRRRQAPPPWATETPCLRRRVPPTSRRTGRSARPAPAAQRLCAISGPNGENSARLGSLRLGGERDGRRFVLLQRPRLLPILRLYCIHLVPCCTTSDGLAVRIPATRAEVGRFGHDHGRGSNEAERFRRLQQRRRMGLVTIDDNG